MKIHIITGHFYPQVHPRAFRANELALELARLGYEVKVTNCYTIKDFDYHEYARKHNLIIENLNFFVTEQNMSTTAPVSRKGKISKWTHRIMEYLFAGRTLINARRLSRLIKIDNDVDAVIALSTPFTSILGLSYYLRTSSKKYVTIGDSGDPFYNSKQSPKAPWFYFIEKRVYKDLDYLTIPTNNAFNIYTPMIPQDKIKVIPQGFRMDNLEIYKGELSIPVTFAYAGVFYWDIRNPQFLFKYLSTLKVDFKFCIYLRAYDNNLVKLIDTYPNIKDKICIEYSVPREELISKLSKAHFLINIENLSNTQMPSKLIDYAITERPIYSCKANNFSPQIFNKFMSGDYSHKYSINKDEYNISLVVSKFLKLIEDAKNEN